METLTKTFEVTYTKAIGGDNTILVLANSPERALKNAKFNCFTGRNFRNPIETDKSYIKPTKLGYQGSNRAN